MKLAVNIMIAATNQSVAVAAAARRSLDDACAAGFADADFSCVARLLRGPASADRPAAGPGPPPARSSARCRPGCRTTPATPS